MHNNNETFMIFDSKTKLLKKICMFEFYQKSSIFSKSFRKSFNNLFSKTFKIRILRKISWKWLHRSLHYTEFIFVLLWRVGNSLNFDPLLMVYWQILLPNFAVSQHEQLIKLQSIPINIFPRITSGLNYWIINQHNYSNEIPSFIQNLFW